MKSVVSLWDGVYLLDDSRVLESISVSRDLPSLTARARLRAEGRRTPEEEAALTRCGPARWGTRDRRLVGGSVVFDATAAADVERAPAHDDHRRAILEDGEQAVIRAWDPSVHVQEAVRTVRDADRALNLLGERIAGWAAHDAPGVDPEDPDSAARAVVEGTESSPFSPAEPELRAGRRRLAEAYLSLRAAREEIGRAVEASSPQRTPQLAKLLGADLAARLVAQAGGLDRLARLPASTVQVLGAEKAFFEHLRGRAPPPRHGLLFLHPAIQSSPRSDRGRLARSLAAKAAIAARMDRAGTTEDPGLKAAFENRRTQLREQREARTTGARKRRSALPLDRTAEDRDR